MEARVSSPAKDFIIAQPTAGRLQLMQAIEEIENDPLIGQYLPFPWDTNVLGYGSGGYWITYGLNDGVVQIWGIVRMPDISAIMDP